MRQATIQIRRRLIPIQADGTACAFCDDVVWLRAFRLQFLIGSRPIAETGSSVCQSCADALRSTQGSGPCREG